MTKLSLMKKLSRVIREMNIEEEQRGENMTVKEPGASYGAKRRRSKKAAKKK